MPITNRLGIGKATIETIRKCSRCGRVELSYASMMNHLNICQPDHIGKELTEIIDYVPVV